MNNSTRLIGKNAQREQKKSRNGSRDDTADIWRFEKFSFWRNHKEVFNQLNSVSSIDGGSYVRRSHKVIVKIGIIKMTKSQKK